MEILSNVNATAAAIGNMDDLVEYGKFMIEPVADWTWSQLAIFPVLFVLPAEILAKVIDVIIFFLGYGKDALPERAVYPPLNSTDNLYIWFNRLVMLPFVSFLNIRMIMASSAVAYDEMTFVNTVVAFLVIFSLSDLVYYTG